MMNCIICNRPGCQSHLSHGHGWICGNCIKAAGGMKNWFTIRNMAVDDIRDLVNKANEKQGESVTVKHPLYGTPVSIKPPKTPSTPPSPVISRDSYLSRYIIVDEQTGTVVFPRVTAKGADIHILASPVRKEYSFDDIVGCELIENGSAVTKGGLGAAIAGGMLFGGAGAITGGIVGKKKTETVCKDLRVKVTLRDLSKPAIFIDFLQSPAKTSSSQYLKAQETAQKLVSVLQNICSRQRIVPKAQSPADEIRKYKELLDMGAITESEYQTKKQQLLGL